jgi:hypothetical protein
MKTNKKVKFTKIKNKCSNCNGTKEQCKYLNNKLIKSNNGFLHTFFCKETYNVLDWDLIKSKSTTSKS